MHQAGLSTINGFEYKSGLYLEESGEQRVLYLFMERPNNQGGTNPEKLHMFMCDQVGT